MLSFKELPPFPQNVKSIEDDEVKRWFNIAQKAVNDIQNVFVITSSFKGIGFQSKLANRRFIGRTLQNTDNYISITNADGVSGNLTLGLKNLPISNVLSGKNSAKFYGAISLYYNVTTIGVTSGATEDTLHTYDFDNNVFFNNGDRCTVEMAGAINNTGGFNTYIRLYVGGAVCFDTGNFTPSSTQYWSMKILLNRTTSTNLQVIVIFYSSQSGLTPTTVITNVSVDFISSINVHITGTGFGLANIIEQFLTTINYEKYAA